MEALISSGSFLYNTKKGIPRFNWDKILKEFPGREKIQLLRFFGRSKCKKKFYENKLIFKDELLKEIRKSFNKLNRINDNDNSFQEDDKTLSAQSSKSEITNYFKTDNLPTSNKIRHKNLELSATSKIFNNLSNSFKENNEKEIQVTLDETFYKKAKELYGNEADNTLFLNKERISCVLYNMYFKNYFQSKL